MNKSKIVGWLLFVSAAAALALTPVSVSGIVDSSGLATVDCLDCQPHQFICCADCSEPSQEQKCTLGEPWCPFDP